ncbi:hypothetical protein [uncultured Akkermansia sp.]|uniref:GNAT family N-acetyltransferase n=1 Tax=uncultured Akkermansia sp. TaxID=512294 RepID=UPI00261B2CF4|nr:hypothetical protein [uncultured Akkermansia sp.]
MQAKQAHTVDYIAFPSPGIKSAYDLSGRMEAQTIMERIYNEDPSYWPYGLGIPGHDGVYLIRDKMTKQAAGFVGWQQMLEGGRLIGSYSIGILPEYRGLGFAKEAVAKILREKAAGVDITGLAGTSLGGKTRIYLVFCSGKTLNHASPSAARTPSRKCFSVMLVPECPSPMDPRGYRVFWRLRMRRTNGAGHCVVT